MLAPGISVAVTAALLTAGAPASEQREQEGAPEKVLWSPGLCVAAKVNGAALKLTIVSNGAVAVDLNPDAAVRAGLVARGFQRFFGVLDTVDAVDASVSFTGHLRTQTVQILDHPPEQVAVVWHEHTRINPTCDGYVSAWLVAAPKIRLVQDAAPETTREVVIPMQSDRQWLPGYDGRLDRGGEAYHGAIDLTAPDTVVNAPAARRLVRDGRLRLSGEVRMHLVRYGVERPAEKGEFVDFKPFGFTVPEVYAHGARVAPTPHGPDEVAPVIVEGRPRKDEARPAITLGYKALASCRSLTFDRTTHTITLACAE